MTPGGQRALGERTHLLWASKHVCCVFLMMGCGGDGWEGEGHRGSGNTLPGVWMHVQTPKEEAWDRKKDTERWRQGGRGREICHFNDHFYGLGELGGSHTAPSLTTVQQTPDRRISVRALLSQSERQIYLQPSSPRRIGFKWLWGGAAVASGWEKRACNRNVIKEQSPFTRFLCYCAVQSETHRGIVTAEFIQN